MTDMIAQFGDFERAADSSEAVEGQLAQLCLSSRFQRDVLTAAGESAPPIGESSAAAAAEETTTVVVANLVDGTTVVVANLVDGTTEADVAAKFADCGAIVAIRLATDRETGGFRRFGHVTFASPEAAAAALALAGTPVAGRPGRMIRVERWEDSVVDAVERGDLAAVTAWFATGRCDVDDRSGTFPAYPQCGWPLLTRAARNGDAQIMRFLISRGADVALETNEAMQELVPVTPLHVAIVRRRYDITALLLDAGVDGGAEPEFAGSDAP